MQSVRRVRELCNGTAQEQRSWHLVRSREFFVSYVRAELQSDRETVKWNRVRSLKRPGFKTANTNNQERAKFKGVSRQKQSVKKWSLSRRAGSFQDWTSFRHGKSLTLIFQSASPHRCSFDHGSPPWRRLDTRTLTVFPQNVSSDSNWVSAHSHTHSPFVQGDGRHVDTATQGMLEVVVSKSVKSRNDFSLWTSTGTLLRWVFSVIRRTLERI